MKTDMRHELARQPFEQKISKVGQLLQLSAKLKAQRGANNGDFTARDPLIISAIRRKAVLKFTYNGKLRTVEPQTYGLSTTGREILRAYERPTTNGLKRSGMAKLFDLKKISNLRDSGQKFREALPAHNPNDSAMVEIFATLPAPKN